MWVIGSGFAEAGAPRDVARLAPAPSSWRSSTKTDWRRSPVTRISHFPTTGLAGLVDDPDPYVRRLAARDPDLDPAVADRLTGDPEKLVRQAMAASPVLPTDRVIALLDDPDLGESAASNPALPTAVMRDRIEAAGAT
jgi:hypothetical protein